MLSILISTFREWPAWIMVALGFYIAYRVLKFPDLTVDASFIAGTVGAACAAVNWNSSFWGLILAILLSGIAGLATSLVYLSNPRPAYKLLAGVLVIFAFYSINYRVLGYQVEAGFVAKHTFMNMIVEFEASHRMNTLRPLSFSLGMVLVVIQVIFLWWLLHTSYGLVLRTIGSRYQLIMKNKIHVAGYLISGLVLSNIIVGIGGWYYGSTNGYASINVFGTIIHALAAAIIGETIVEHVPIGKDRRASVWPLLVAPIVGVTVYQFLKACVAWFMMKESENISGGGIISINQQDHNTFVAVFLVLLIIVARWLASLHKTDIPDTEDSVE